MELTNDSMEQRLTIRLKKNIKREYEFRLFLDTNSSYGVNRKEIVLQMYETLLANGFIDEELMLQHSPIISIDKVSDIIEENEKKFKNSMKKESQKKIEEVDAEDFGAI